MLNAADSMVEAVDLLAFGPHPDDVELFCGGLMLLMAEKGYRTAIVDLTWGERASQGTPETRRAECAEASRLLKLVCRTNLELPDTLLPPLAWAAIAQGTGGLYPDALTNPPAVIVPQDVEMALAKIVTILRQLRPEIVVIPPDKERHPDHVAAHHLIMQALFYAHVRHYPHAGHLPPFEPNQVLIYPMRVEWEPTFVVDISPVVERKQQVVQAYASQVTRVPRPGESTAEGGTLLSSPLAMSILKTRDQVAGAKIGTAAGEPYWSVNTLGIGDPIDHFRRNRFGRPHLFAPPSR